MKNDATTETNATTPLTPLERLADIASACQRQAQLNFERALRIQDENAVGYAALGDHALAVAKRRLDMPTGNRGRARG